ncbi:FAD:protein FMN transferase [Cohnella sp. REN36]|uniref:FAD:protein FMN transferase n=1 Tax=Cohnella sp. REN36 TaxID=2887347 RepID=UPI001D13E26A|nr:FAD:protein FMN transferase [Cohnella sp. REN36]MCC3373918.1 FAD:protein FMN transferase [Cohnella sp. REN36]
MAAADQNVAAEGMHVFRAMNTTVATAGLGPRDRARAEAWFADAERRLSRFRPDSELADLNRTAGTGAAVLPSPLLRQALWEAHRCHLETAGVFNPFLGGTLAAYGYDESFERLTAREAATPFRPSPQTANGRERPVLQALAAVTLPDGPLTLPPDAAVDLGGIAKGWCAAELAARLRGEGVTTGAVDVGGDIALWGAPPGGWEIGVADPYDEEADVATIWLRGSAGVATSTETKRAWRDADGRELHHLLDPATMAPARSDLVQATVIAPDATAAEVYAKCLLILGAETGIPWLKRLRPECAYIAVGRDKQLYVDPALTGGGDRHVTLA